MKYPLASRNYFLLIIVSLIIFIALFFVFENLQMSIVKTLTPIRKQEMLENTIHWVKTNNHRKVLRTNRWMKVFLKRDKLPGALVLTTTQPLQKQHVLESLEKQQSYAILMKNGHWLNIHFRKSGVNAVVVAGDIVIITLLLCLLCGFYYWLVGSMTRPLKNLSLLADDLSNGFGRIKYIDQSVPEVNRVVEAVNQLQENIRKLMRDRTHMLAAISHDLRTPITRLKLRLEAFEHAPQFDKLMRDLSEMERMIDSVLGFVQHESEENAINFDLSALVETVVHDMSDAGFDVMMAKLDDNVSLVGQMHELKRAISNVIDNAIKYGQSAKVSLCYENNEAVLTVDDKGPGIHEDEIKKVFQPFYRVDKSRNLNTGGAGLGLVITKNIIEQNNGRITLKNLRPHGLRVQIKF